MKTELLKSHVTDTNHCDCGLMDVAVEFLNGKPSTVEHKNHRFNFTGKTGTNFKTGELVFEMATDADARLWINLDGSKIWED